MDLAGKTATALARRSSRRQFFKFLGAGSLGAGLFLARTDVTLGSITHCVGCGGGPCNPCGSPFQQCLAMPCKPCQQGAGCPVGCATTGEWFCCETRPPPFRTGCRYRCSECSCPSPQGCCACFTSQPMPCTPRRHSGDQPCPCPSVDAPVPSLAADG
jgi:hypothetical protein